MGGLIDLTGQRFGRLTVIRKLSKEERTATKSSSAQWLCKCDCGTEVKVLSINLTRGATKSCGCLHDEHGGWNFLDLTGQRFGKLVAVKRVEDHITPSGQHKTSWLCKCDCGCEKIVTTNALRGGKTTSCGCSTQSTGEQRISKLLLKAGIPFEREKVVNIQDHYLRFDFFVDNKYFIEFNGQQHEEMHTGYYNGLEGFELQQERDRLKQEYCQENNIPLIIIPYDKLSTITIDDLILGDI